MPWPGFMQDISIVIKNILNFTLFRGIWRLVFALITSSQIDNELYILDPKNVWSILVQAILILLFPISFLVWIIQIIRVYNGHKYELLTYGGDNTIPEGNERSFFINGVCTGEHWLKLNCKRLERCMNPRRRIKGIHNISHGFIVDLFESLLQRNFDVDPTGCRDVTVEIIGRELRDNNVTKVTLFAHSQGAIITRLVLDEFHNQVQKGQLTEGQLGKLRVITFASVAKKFNSKDTDPPIIKSIQHYVNYDDFFAELGVLTFSRAEDGTPNRDYRGDIFMNKYAMGHVFNTFYSAFLFEPYDKHVRGSPDVYATLS